MIEIKEHYVMVTSVKIDEIRHKFTFEMKCEIMPLNLHRALAAFILSFSIDLPHLKHYLCNI